MSNKKRRRSKSKSDTKSHGAGRERDARYDDAKRGDHRGGRENEFINGSAGSNDPSWWNRAGQLSKDSASFAFSQAVGSPMRSFELYKNHFTAAGIMVLDYVPTFGTIRSSADPVNIAARLLYDTVNSKNSRTPTYDPSDLLVYTVAIANAWAIHAWARRVVGTYNTFDPNNRYWAKAVRLAMGVAPDDTDQLMVKWRDVANWMAVRLNMFNVPAGIPYYQREIFMNNAIYMDDSNMKASYFMFNPRAFLKLVDRDDQHPSWVGGLVYKEFPSNIGGGITPDVLWNYFEEITAPLFNDSTVPVMSADIEKAFGLANCFRLPMVDETEVTIPVYNREVLMQINNARFYPSASVDSLLTNYVVKQDPNTNTLRATLLLYADNDRYERAVRNLRTYGLPINFPMDVPTVDDTIEATRLMWCQDPNRNNLNEIQTCSTEILVGSYIFKFEDDDAGEWKLTNLENPHENVFVIGTTNFADFIEKVRSYEQFGWAPILQVFSAPNGNSQPNRGYCLSDVYNYSSLVYEDLRVMNDACWLSILGAV